MAIKTIDKILVTGAAGFIGSHLSEHLLNLDIEVYALDNLSTGKISNIQNLFDNSKFHFVKGDLLNSNELKVIVKKCDCIFHLAANPEVQVAFTDSRLDFHQNLVATHRLLDMMRKNKRPRLIVYTSTSNVYGEAKVIPTPENYGPMVPISLYAATKLGSEALISSYEHTFGINGLVFRLANIVGSRLKHGVIYDFIHKLRVNSEELEILGDGKQNKSYLHIIDCLKGIFAALESFDSGFKVYNVGGDDQVKVKTIAEIIVDEMKINSVKFTFKNKFHGRGWPGDVKNMLLDCSKLKGLGWRPQYTGIESIRLTTSEIINDTENSF